MASTASAYDNVHYTTAAFPETHPDRLAVMATLFGLDPPDIEHCRVLEIACGDGGNLIPMAYGLPGSEFVGVDIAGKPVAIGQGRAERAGLKNVRLEHLDLLDVGREFGEFDYIIAHGVYAWVPRAVQQKILSICCKNLSSNGIAFVSYNTKPAGQLREILRSLIHFHEQRSAGQADRVQQARHVVQCVLQAAEPESAWKSVLEKEFQKNFNRDDNFVYHDDLAECFSPLSLSEFVQGAADAGLQYLSEAELSDLSAPQLSAEADAALASLADGDAMAYRQYLDFAQCRRFHRTLLCHAGVPLRRERIPERMKKVLVASPMRASPNQPEGAVEFLDFRSSGAIKTNNPLLIAALRRLERIWPRAERFEDFQAAVLGPVPEAQRTEVAAELVRAMLNLAANKLVDFRVHRIQIAERLSEKPTASLLARLMVRDSSLVTTMLHINVRLEDENSRQLLELLDGTRGRQELAGATVAGPETTSDDERLRKVDGYLDSLYRLGLLVA